MTMSIHLHTFFILYHLQKKLRSACRLDSDHWGTTKFYFFLSVMNSLGEVSCWKSVRRFLGIRRLKQKVVPCPKRDSNPAQTCIQVQVQVVYLVLSFSFSGYYFPVCRNPWNLQLPATLIETKQKCQTKSVKSHWKHTQH